jgi:hypothetical protein
MKRILLVGWLTVLVACSSKGQITSLNGRLEYRHEYSDVLSDTRLSTSVSRTPLFAMNMGGFVVAPQLLLFNLSTDLSANGAISHSGNIDYTVKQYSWDYYRLFLNILPYSLVKFDLSTRAGIYEIGTEVNTASSYFMRAMRDEQSVSASSNKIKWLPAAQLSFRRTHTYSVAGTSTDITDRRYAFVLSTANEISSINVVGSMSDIEDKEFITRNKVYDLSLDATREYSEKSRFDLGAQYNRYDAYTLLSANAAYSNSELERLTSATSIYASNSSSEFYRAFAAGGRQGFTYTPSDDLRLSINLGGKSGNEIHYTADGATKYPMYELSAMTGLSRSGAIGPMKIGNGISFSFGRQRIWETVSNVSGGLSNSVSVTVKGFDLSASHSIGAGVQYNSVRTSNVSNIADFRAIGRLWKVVQSATTLNFRDDRFAGHASEFRDYRFLSIRQQFRTSGYYLVPFSVELSGNVNWYARGANGRTYGWSFQLQSGSFFLRSLSFDYRYNRSYDLFYRFEVVDQAARLTYPWRMISMELRLSELRTIDRRRQAWFSIIRPF